MNQRNIEALTRAIVDGIDYVRQGQKVEPAQWTSAHLGVLAAWMSWHGVLVASALTDHEVDVTIDSGKSRSAVEIRSPDDFRATLERIAKGEAS